MEGYFTFQWGWFVFQMRGPQLQVGKGRIPNSRGIGFGRAGGGGGGRIIFTISYSLITLET